MTSLLFRLHFKSPILDPPEKCEFKPQIVIHRKNSRSSIDLISSSQTSITGKTHIDWKISSSTRSSLDQRYLYSGNVTRFSPAGEIRDTINDLMGKNKRLRIVKTGELQQQSAEVEHRIEQHSTISEATDSVQQSDDGPQKKVWRHTRKQAIWDLESDERIEVYFNELGQPVGDEGNELTSFLGTLVKMSNHLSIEHLDWRKVSDDKKEDLWSLVKGRFIFLPAETKRVKDWVLSDMGTKFKSWKYELKKKWYDPSSTIDGIVDTQNDSRVDKSQFKKLVTYCCDPSSTIVILARINKGVDVTGAGFCTFAAAP